MGVIGPEARKQLLVAGRFAAAGMELVVAIVVGYFGGRALDRWLGSEPWCGYVGLLLGIAAGFYNLFQLARSGAKPLPPPDAPEKDESSPPP